MPAHVKRKSILASKQARAYFKMVHMHRRPSPSLHTDSTGGTAPGWAAAGRAARGRACHGHLHAPLPVLV